MKKILKGLVFLFLAGICCVGCSGKTGHTNEYDNELNEINNKEYTDAITETSTVDDDSNENEPAMIQTFTESDVIVIPEIETCDFMTAKDMGTVQQIQGMLPGASEGVWYIVSIDGVEYYYGKYASTDSEEADYFGYAVFSDSYSLQNGISVGMTMEEVLEKYSDMAVINFDNSYLGEKVTGNLGWNPNAYPLSYIGMDEDWDYAGKDYEWSDQFDCIMIANIDLGMEDVLPRYLGLMIKDRTVAAITFYYPTAG